MTVSDEQLHAARQTYHGLSYQGDLAADVGVTVQPSLRWRKMMLGAAAMIGLLLVLSIMIPATDDADHGDTARHGRLGALRMPDMPTLGMSILSSPPRTSAPNLPATIKKTPAYTGIPGLRQLLQSDLSHHSKEPTS